MIAGLRRFEPHIQIDSTLVRLFFVLLGLAGNGIGVLIYLLLWIIVPWKAAGQCRLERDGSLGQPGDRR
jgi:hypothetical protein